MRSEVEVRITPKELAAIRGCVEQALAQQEIAGTPPSEHTTALRTVLIKLKETVYAE